MAVSVARGRGVAGAGVVVTGAGTGMICMMGTARGTVVQRTGVLHPVVTVPRVGEMGALAVRAQAAQPHDGEAGRAEGETEAVGIHGNR